jgi:ATP-dependent Clp protease ATP-binding subunit ClpA
MTIAKPLSDKIIAGEFASGDRIQVTARDNKIVFSKTRRSKE